MNNISKIALNVLIFAVIAGFGYYMVRSMSADKRTIRAGEERVESTLVSPYKEINRIEVDSDILSFDICKDAVFVAFNDRVSVFELSGHHRQDVAISEGIRDIAIDFGTMILLYPTTIKMLSYDGRNLREWRACDDNSDYVAITTCNDYIFVTDANNKNVVQYDKQGRLVRFITSPDRFIIPSHVFDIININDTIYVVNSGRHRIESYTRNGEFIASFGQSGRQPGAFAGCCNPVFIAATPGGNILTSEKGNPRISSYTRDGKFRTILFDAQMLGGGTDAYRMRVSGDYIYIAGRQTISIFGKDEALCPSSGRACNRTCGGCRK